MKDLSRTVEMVCPTCGCSLFKDRNDLDNDYAEVTCGNCGRVLSKDELISENQESIDAHVKEIGSAAIKEIAKQFKFKFK